MIIDISNRHKKKLNYVRVYIMALLTCLVCLLLMKNKEYKLLIHSLLFSAKTKNKSLAATIGANDFFAFLYATKVDNF